MFSHTRLSRSLAGLSRTFLLTITDYVEVRTPECTHSGLGSSHFARRYFGNRCFFLFLSLLRCFSSGGSPSYVMDWRMSTWSLSMWVSPFRNLRIKGYLLLPEAYRSLSRLSSALSAKASALCPSLLDWSFPPHQGWLPPARPSVGGIRRLSFDLLLVCFSGRNDVASLKRCNLSHS